LHLHDLLLAWWLVRVKFDSFQSPVSLQLSYTSLAIGQKLLGEGGLLNISRLTHSW
jgi:hypothetical protein